VFVESASAGNVATFAIQGVEKEKLRKGMVITKSPKKGTRTFRARIVVLHHPTTIRRGYVATVHLKTIRQAARFVDMDKQYVRTGDITSATLEFLYRPEYLEPGSVFVFREGRTRGIGVVNEVLANR
jgi:elongation factor 1-alpha